jgi:hypothetical protein
MMDGASTNRSFTNMMFDINPRVKLFQFPDVYDFTHSICAIQDIMHVLKRIRNNIESSKLQHEQKKGRLLTLNDSYIVWDYWVECFTFNIQNGFGIHAKLTPEHINLTPASKMRNSLALEVLNNDMLFLMKSFQSTLPDPERLTSAIELLEHTSILVDVFCNCNQPLFSLSDDRFKSLKETLAFFNQWEHDIEESALHKKEKHLLTQETRDDLNSAITGFTSLCQLRLGKGNSINPGFINSDIVENLFGQHRGIRNGLNNNPTLSQYGPSTTAIILGQCSVTNKCNSGKSAAFFSASTPRALNVTRNKMQLQKKRSIRM